ncbi:glycerophosphoryl diester phosphodiesterase [Halogeometricum pallidum JCM 14848]|uniref:Glycerophosphoryl diester phosphodiesterase n=1 Tax=Halogeometricum pallidum JCM 14848 TaxID=1227487 RepID=M0CST3_HALPD|nr:glycerophosphodiester phosphodiesterase family protein [Halogeometricum pallidum]ELZ26271.1 glycerophosphoryl diester phosphodiesterase [Halogeometricum pallidum JCM 14848]
MSSDEHEVGRRSFVAGTGALLGASSLGGVAAATHEDANGTESENHGNEHWSGGHSEPEIIAHRGFAGVYPENTLGAFGRATWGDDADMIELDIIPSADGEVMVIHDPDLSSRDEGTRGLTDLDGYVWEYTADELREADVLQSGESVPTLGEVFDLIPDSVGVNIEFKNPDTTDTYTSQKLSEERLSQQMEVWRPMAEKALDIAGNYENDVLVSSFAEAAIAVVRDIDPDVPVAYLFWDSIETGLEITREYDCEAIHPPYNMVKGTPFFGDEYYLSGPFADVDLVKVAHEEGRAVNVWTIGTWYQAEQLTAAGVDGLIADYPNLLWSGNDEMEWDDPDSGDGEATETGTETSTEAEAETATGTETETETTTGTANGTEIETGTTAPASTGTGTDGGN